MSQQDNLQKTLVILDPTLKLSFTLAGNARDKDGQLIKEIQLAGWYKS